MSPLRTMRPLRSAFAAALAAVLVAAAPGLASYEAAAQVVTGAAGAEGRVIPSGVFNGAAAGGVSPIPSGALLVPALNSSFNIGSVPLPLNGASGSASALVRVAPTLLPASALSEASASRLIPAADGTPRAEISAAVLRTAPAVAHDRGGVAVTARGELALAVENLESARGEGAQAGVLDRFFSGLRRSFRFGDAIPARASNAAAAVEKERPASGALRAAPPSSVALIGDGLNPGTDLLAGPVPAPAPNRLRRALRSAAIAVPAVALAALVGVFAPHAALLGVHWLGQAVYWLSTPFAFVYTIPQIFQMLSHRSADVPAGMMTIGVAATAASALNFAFVDKSLMMYRNLAQMLGFVAMLVLKWRYARAPGQTPPSKRRALVETGAVTLGILGLMFAAGPLLMAAIPGIALMGSLLIPIQIASGFGFTYLMYVQLSKMRRTGSAGDSSRGMLWAYLGTKATWVWSLATLLSLATAPAWLVLAAAGTFTAVCWVAGRLGLSSLVRAKWAFLPEKATLLGRTLPHETLVDIAAFVAMALGILGLSATGYFALIGLLGIPAAASSQFGMYLLYMVQSLVASLATLKALRLQARLGREPKPSDKK